MTHLTVLMTVYNGEAFLRETVESILNQTYRDFKFLVVDNASTDSSREIIRSFDDPRIQLASLPENIGQIPALNKGLSMIETPYIARMDADDISLTRRFEKQIAFLETHPEVGVCGTHAIAFNGKQEILWEHPAHHEDIKVQLLFECCLVHPSVMMRKAFLDEYGLNYNELIGHSEDWELWQRCAKHFRLANISEVLVRYRIHCQSVSRQTLDRQHAAAQMLDNASLRLLGLDHHRLRQVHRDVAFETFNAGNRESSFLDDVAEWFGQLTSANSREGIYQLDALKRFLKKRLFVVLTSNAMHRRRGLGILLREKLYRYVPLSWILKYLVKLMLPFFGREEHDGARRKKGTKYCAPTNTSTNH